MLPYLELFDGKIVHCRLIINSFAYLILIGSLEEELLPVKSDEDCATSGFSSDFVDLSLHEFDGIVTIISAARTRHTDPTIIKGSKKPPMPYNQAPMAGPNQN